MTEKPVSAWLKFGMKFISFLEAIIPAFLLAWNQQLRNGLKRERNSHDNTKLELDVVNKRKEIEAKYDGKTDRDVIDDFLADNGRGSNDDASGSP